MKIRAHRRFKALRKTNSDLSQAQKTEISAIVAETSSIISLVNSGKEKDSLGRIKQLENSIQEKDSMLHELANMLLEQGFTKEQIFAKTGVKL